MYSTLARAAPPHHLHACQVLSVLARAMQLSVFSIFQFHPSRFPTASERFPTTSAGPACLQGQLGDVAHGTGAAAAGTAAWRTRRTALGQLLQGQLRGGRGARHWASCCRDSCVEDANDTGRNSAAMALRSPALVVALLGATASGQHHGMDPFAGSKCTCATFCDGSCDIADVGQKTMELFRMTQFGVVGTLRAHAPRPAAACRLAHVPRRACRHDQQEHRQCARRHQFRHLAPHAGLRVSPEPKLLSVWLRDGAIPRRRTELHRPCTAGVHRLRRQIRPVRSH
eukprot:COSAG02_NODE_275_length_26232_cov_85.210424_20_plen_284_part_00